MSLNKSQQNMQDAIKEVQEYNPPVNLPKKRFDHNPKYILLTGANGFLAVHLIEEMQNNTNAFIYCLIRGEDLEQAKHKLNTNVKRYEVKVDMSKLKVLHGDLAQENFGLSDDNWKDICNNVDWVIHNGAYVHHLQTHSRMSPTNVGSVKTVIKLATTNKLKSIHFVSTKFAACASDGKPQEGMPPIGGLAEPMSFGYVTTKWTGEWLLWKASSYGLPVSIYRIGVILGNSKNGIANYENNNYTHFIRGCIQMGYAPNSQNILEFLPVDIVAQSIVTLAKDNTDDKPKAWNVLNPDQFTWGDVVFPLIKKLGYTLEIIPVPDWYQKLEKVNESNSLYRLIGFHKKNHENKESPIECTHTSNKLKSLGINISPKIQDLFPLYFQYWHSVGLY